MTASRKLIAGNWKMNGLSADAKERVAALVSFVAQKPDNSFDMVICPPATLIRDVSSGLQGSHITCGGQDCHAEASGAFTGNISAPMLKDMGCTHVILGHSERRQYHAETDEQVSAKAKAAHAAGLIAIVCVGETDEQRTAGQQDAIVTKQLQNSLPDGCTAENTVVAYEPVWAIGTGKTASSDDIRNMHAVIRRVVSEKIKDGDKLRLLYGGSVKGANAAEILHIDHVDGVLVGGASLKADEFGAIAAAA